MQIRDNPKGFRKNLKREIKANLWHSSANQCLDVYSIEEFFYTAQSQGFFVSTKTLNKYAILPKQVDWINKMYSQSAKITAFLASRDKGKTEIGSVLGVSYLLYHNPSLKFAVVAGTYKRASSIVNTIRDILSCFNLPMTSKHGEIRTRLNRDFSPSVRAYGIDASIRGDHYNYLIFDDPIEEKDRFSHIKRDNLESRFGEAHNIAQYIIVVGQLLTRQDLYWKLKNNPAVHLIESWYGDIPELDPNLATLRATKPESFINRNYLGKISDEDVCEFNVIQLVDEPVKGTAIAVLDPNLSDKEGSDWVALTIIWKVNGINIAKGFVWNRPWYDLIEIIADIYFEHGCSEFHYETNAPGTAPTKLFRTIGIKNIHEFSTKPGHGAKEVRILGKVGDVKRGLLRLSIDSEADYIANVLNWPDVEHDDPIDCLVMADDIANKRIRGSQWR